MSIEFADPTMLTLPAGPGGAVLALLPEMLAGFSSAAGSEGGGLSGFLSSAPMDARSNAADGPESWFEIPAALTPPATGGSAYAYALGSAAAEENEAPSIEAGPDLLIGSPGNETEGGESGESGDDDGGVTITGRRPPLPELPDDDTADGGGGAGDGGSGGTGSESEQNDCRDRAALAATQEVKEESDDEVDEHASVIYRDANGQVQRSPLIEGDVEGIPFNEILAWLASNGVSMSQVIGLVHNHPAYVYGQSDESANVNRYPSGGVLNGGDWIAAERMVSLGAGGPNGANFAMYVIDTIGKVREFEYVDREIYKNLSKEERDDGDALPDIMMDDGTSCG
jgi:hypothetical protein